MCSVVSSNPPAAKLEPDVLYRNPGAISDLEVILRMETMCQKREQSLITVEPATNSRPSHFFYTSEEILVCFSLCF